jgi:DNA-directed RNA polymerase specialized sigma24 family protein
MDHNEVAAALDISPDNARARVSRARARLRELLEVS